MVRKAICLARAFFLGGWFFFSLQEWNCGSLAVLIWVFYELGLVLTKPHLSDLAQMQIHPTDVISNMNTHILMHCKDAHPSLHVWVEQESLRHKNNFSTVLMSSSWKHAATWQQCHSNNKVTTIVERLVQRGNTNKCMFTEQTNTSSSLDSLLIGQNYFTCALLFQERNGRTESTHLNGQKTIRIGKNTVGVNVTLEPLGTKNNRYGQPLWWQREPRWVQNKLVDLVTNFPLQPGVWWKNSTCVQIIRKIEYINMKRGLFINQ